RSRPLSAPPELADLVNPTMLQHGRARVRLAADEGGGMSYLDDLFSVAGKKALVTGAATGIGRMIATALVEAGADVLIASRKGADCEKVAGELNALGRGRAEGFAGDVSTEAGVLALVEEV